MKFRNKSIILDDILDCQRSPFDKSGLGYNLGKEKLVANTWTPNRYDESPSFSKSESNVAMHVPAQNKEDIIKSGSHQGFSPTPQSKLRKETSSRKNHASKYENSFNGYFYVCNDFGHTELDCTSHAKSVRTPNNTVRCWKCNYVVHIAANCHTMICYNFYV